MEKNVHRECFALKEYSKVVSFIMRLSVNLLIKHFQGIFCQKYCRCYDKVTAMLKIFFEMVEKKLNFDVKYNKNILLRLFLNSGFY